MLRIINITLIAWVRMVALIAATMLATAAGATAWAAPLIPYRVLKVYPHPTDAFTEGLAINGNTIIESDGLYGESRIVIRTLRGQKLLNRFDLPANVFGEGITMADGRIVQLTWRAHIGYVYSPKLKLLRSFKLDGQGWGLTFDGKRLIVSDGSDRLHFLDPRTFQPVGTPLLVRDGNTPVMQLNELEYAQGKIYANIWHDARVAQISPQSGQVLGWLDLSPLLRDSVPIQNSATQESVANGIAWDPVSGLFFVTGKNWRHMYEISVAGVGPQSATRATPQ